MKNLKKVLAVLTAVSAMAAQVSAFAANEATVSGDITGTYAANEEGTYKLTVTTPTAAKADTDMTLLVLDEDANPEAIADGDILYIDQGIVGTDNFANLGLKDEIINTETTTGHIIKVGYYDAEGNFAIAEGTIAVVAATPDTITVEFKVGDVNKADGVNSTDANYILSWLTGGSASVGGDYDIGEGIVDTSNVTTIFGDVNGADGVNSTDANYILSWLTGGSASVGAAKGIGETLTLTVPAN